MYNMGENIYEENRKIIVQKIRENWIKAPLYLCVKFPKQFKSKTKNKQKNISAASKGKEKKGGEK